MTISERFGRALLHNHTIYSDGVMTPVELLVSCQQYPEKVDIFAITDHNSIRGYDFLINYMLQNNISAPKLIPGVEVTSPLHLLVYPKKNPFEIPQLLGFERTVDFIFNKDEEAVILVAHPGKNHRFLLDPQAYVRKGINGAETRSPYNWPLEWLVSARYEQIRREGNKKFSAVAGGDNHFPYPYGTGWQYHTLFPGFTTEDLFNALLEGTIIAVVDKSIKVRLPSLEMTAERHRKALLDPLLPPSRR